MGYVKIYMRGGLIKRFMKNGYYKKKLGMNFSFFLPFIFFPQII